MNEVYERIEAVEQVLLALAHHIATESPPLAERIAICMQAHEYASNSEHAKRLFRTCSRLLAN